VTDHAALAAVAVNANVQARVLVCVDKAVYIRVVCLDVFHCGAFIHLVFLVLAGLNVGNVEFLDFTVVAHNE